MTVSIMNPAFNTVPQPVLPSTIDIDAAGLGAAAGTLAVGERQLFGLQITAGDTVTINANAGVGSNLDTVLKVFLPDVTAEINAPGIEADQVSVDVGAIEADPFTIAENDDITPPGLDSSVTFTATVTGLHYVSVAALVGTTFTGDFTLSVSGVTNPGTIGAEAINGAGFNDVLEANAGADIVSGGAGADILLGQSGADIIYGNQEIDTLSGGDGNDIIYGGQNNALNADGTRAIEDVLNTDGFTFRQVQTGGREFLFGGSGDDILYGNFGTDVFSGDTGADTIFGGQGDDEANGGSENDSLFGNRGNDILSGDTGSDTLNGGTGNDTLAGGTGSDVFVFNAGSGTDVIGDFVAGTDAIQVSANLNGNSTFATEDYVSLVTGDGTTGEAIINLGNNADGSANSIKLTGVQANAVNSDFFTFG